MVYIKNYAADTILVMIAALSRSETVSKCSAVWASFVRLFIAGFAFGRLT